MRIEVRNRCDDFNTYRAARVKSLFNAESGSPFTPAQAYDEASLAAVAISPIGTLNSRYGPWRYQLDLKANKDFRVGTQGVSAYVQVNNVFNRKNATAVYASSGTAETTGFLDTDNGRNNLASDPSYGSIYRLARG